MLVVVEGGQTRVRWTKNDVEVAVPPPQSSNGVTHVRLAALGWARGTLKEQTCIGHRRRDREIEARASTSIQQGAGTKGGQITKHAQG